MSGKIGNLIVTPRQLLVWGLAACAAVMLLVAGIGHTAHAAVYPLSNKGPSDPRTRYVLEYSDTTNATTISVPVYYKTNPGTVTVQANDFKRYTADGSNVKVKFNGGSGVSSNSSFSLGGFALDPSSGWYKSTITATMSNYGGTKKWSHYIHFRLTLSNASGYIGYGGGYFQQASRDYYDRSPASNYSLTFATPCSVTSDTTMPLRFYDLDSGNPDNGGYPLTLRIYDETTGTLLKTYKGDSYKNMQTSGASFTVQHKFVPLHKYRVDVIQVSPNNVIQYNFPYDNIAYAVGCPWSLSPSISVPSTEAEVGATISVLPKVDNSGVVSSSTVNWRLSYIQIPSGVSVPGAANSSLSPCSYYGTGGRTCTTATFTSGGAATGSRTFPSGTYNFVTRYANVGDLPVGTRVCYALSVKDRSSTSTQWRHSAPDCVILSKRPVTQVLGGDLIVGRALSPGSAITTNVKIVGGSRYGSYGEYGVIASGRVSGMASASGYAGGVTTSSLCGVSLLTFSNVVGTGSCSDANIGQYNYTAAASSVANKFSTAVASQISGNVGIDTLTSGKTYTNNGSGSEIRLTAPSGYKVGTGKWIVINAPGANVKIMNNINYTDATLHSLADIPQVVIIARNILIADSVTNVDAWLVATGTGTNGRVNTCGAGGVTETTTLTDAVCDEKLAVNGPVIANRLLLRRTAGAGTGSASGNPAEVFNLRPDAYLWAIGLQTETTKARTVITTELPPRY